MNKEGLNKGRLDGTGGIVYWNLQTQSIETVYGEISKDPISKFAHELWHAYEANSGLTDNTTGQGTWLALMEFGTAYFESYIRQFLHLDLRGIYNYHDPSGSPYKGASTTQAGVFYE
jgi:hypothetical protein